VQAIEQRQNFSFLPRVKAYAPGGHYEQPLQLPRCRAGPDRAGPAARREHPGYQGPGGDHPGPPAPARYRGGRGGGRPDHRGAVPSAQRRRLIARHPDGSVFEYIEAATVAGE